MIWEMTVSIRSSPMSVWDILSLCRDGPDGRAPRGSRRRRRRCRPVGIGRGARRRDQQQQREGRHSLQRVCHPGFSS